MPAFRVKGSTGQAPTTSFFGAIPDMLNVLLPGHEDPTNGDVLTTNQFTADNINKWIPANLTYIGGSNTVTCSFGAMTTAPDGTNTAQKLVESTSNSKHWVTAIARGALKNKSVYTMRLAVFAKAAERTRFALGWRGAAGGTTQSDTLLTTYDLANGVIAVSGSNIDDTSNGFVIHRLGQGMIPFGNGWYLCWLELSLSYFTIAHSIAYLFLDNGSGNAAASPSYTGDGSSGIYTWRSTALPPQAWAMSGQREFFEDFNDPTMANFDLTNSRDPSKTWFINNVWPLTWASSPASFSFSVSNSALNIHNNAGGTGIGTAAWTGTGPYSLWASGTTYVIGSKVAFALPHTDGNFYISLQNGNVGHQPDISPSFWQLQSFTSIGRNFNIMPGFHEANMIFLGNDSSFWYSGLASYMVVSPNGPIQTFSASYNNIPFIELDVMESPASGIEDAHSGFFYGNDMSEVSVPKVSVGYALWNSTINYNFNTFVFFNNTVYNCINGSGSLNEQPDTHPASWATFDPQSTDVTAAPTAGQNQWDPTQFQRWAALCLPQYVGVDAGVPIVYPGQTWWFFNRLPAGQVGYGPSLPAGSTFLQYYENNANVCTLECVGSRNNESQVTKFDYVSITR